MPVSAVPEPAGTLLTETVDARGGVVRARGVLTRTGAELLCGTIETLYRQGHRRVTLDLRDISDIDDEGSAHLEALVGTLTAEHRLGVHVRPPSGERP
jgi:hypothetical protein